MPPLVSILIPTQRRPAPLSAALRSVLAQTGVDFAAVEIVVVDNDQSDSARATLAAIPNPTAAKIIYVHEPHPGVATARNAGVAAAAGRFIAFLDDDEAAAPTWLASLLAAQAQFEADVVFGAIDCAAPAAPPRHRAYLERFFSRIGPGSDGPMDHYYGCGNSLVRRDAFPDPPFSILRNERGGEDDVLFKALKDQGARIVWAESARVWERPEPGRLTLSYAFRRSFAYGQGGSCSKLGPRSSHWAGVALSMATGVAQAGVFGTVAGVLWVTGRPRLAEALEQCARGLGKVFWTSPFSIRFYGQPALIAPGDPPTPTAPSLAYGG